MRELVVPRFAADAMLGRLARWLRVLGYDTTLDVAVHDAELVVCAEREERVLLTRDRRLLRDLRPARALELREDAPLAQLRQVVRALELPSPHERMFTRCMVCNAALSQPLAAEDVRPLLPPGLQQPPPPVRRCGDCGRVYWNGSHVRRMRAALDAALPGWLE
ncbi:Mut7-C RNAse domain-containing protein [Ramlibacter sp. AN1015]|uniref:Mut7-C RNAse domain-containing protein n=1 Tax=Ramlibacter sp. AN1015 TaxID=3133428 RepID=UPI0030BAC296